MTRNKEIGDLIMLNQVTINIFGQMTLYHFYFPPSCQGLNFDQRRRALARWFGGEINVAVPREIGVVKSVFVTHLYRVAAAFASASALRTPPSDEL